MKRHLFNLTLSFFLSACGGSAGTNADAAPSALCNLPDSIVVENNSGHLTQTQTKDGAVVATFTGDAATRAVFNCPLSGTQSLNFDLSTTGFFAAVGDHIAILNNAELDLSVPYYLARGIIIHRDWGVLGERFYLDNATFMVLQCAQPSGSCGLNQLPVQPYVHPLPPGTLDTAQLSVTMVSDAYRTDYGVYGPNGVLAVDQWAESHSFVPMNGTGIAFALLCSYNSCDEQSANFTVNIRNIRASVRIRR